MGDGASASSSGVQQEQELTYPELPDFVRTKTIRYQNQTQDPRSVIVESNSSDRDVGADGAIETVGVYVRMDDFDLFPTFDSERYPQRALFFPYMMMNTFVLAERERNKDWKAVREMISANFILPCPVFTPPLFLLMSGHPRTQRLVAVKRRMLEICNDVQGSSGLGQLSQERMQQLQVEYQELETEQRAHEQLLKQYGEQDKVFERTVNCTTVLEVYAQVLQLLYKLEVATGTDAQSKRRQQEFESVVASETQEHDQRLQRIGEHMFRMLSEHPLVKEMAHTRLNVLVPQVSVWSRERCRNKEFLPLADVFYKAMFSYVVSWINSYELAFVNIFGLTNEKRLKGDENKPLRRMLFCSRQEPNVRKQCSLTLRKMIHEEQLQMLVFKNRLFKPEFFDVLTVQKQGPERYSYNGALSSFALVQMLESYFIKSAPQMPPPPSTDNNVHVDQNINVHVDQINNVHVDHQDDVEMSG